MKQFLFHYLSLTLHKLILGLFLLIKALSEFKEEHAVVRGILKALLADKFLY